MGPHNGPQPAGGILVCFAVPEETVPFRDHPPTGVSMLVSGMGAVRARRAILEPLADSTSRPRLVLTCGFAGGLDPALAVGTVVCEADPDDRHAPLLAALRAAGARPGRIHCAQRVASTATEKRRLRTETGADAVEMESGIIRRLCREHDVPCATVRVISDAAGDDLPLDFNALMTADQRLHPGRLAWAILRSPSVIGGLLQLRRRCVLAARRLDGVLVDALSRLSVGGSQATCRGD